MKAARTVAIRPFQSGFRLAITVGLALLLAVGVLPGMSAQAHEDVIGTSPSDGASVVAGVTEIAVELSAEILLENEGSAIEVLDPSGASLIGPDCTLTDGARLYTLVDLDAPGEYTVNWRSVSQDGHPIDGSFSFTLTNDDGYAAAGERCQAQPDIVIAPAPTETATDTGADANLTGLFIGLGLVIAGSLLAPLGIWLRRRGAGPARSDKPDA